MTRSRRVTMGDLPADLQTEHGRQFHPQGSGARAPAGPAGGRLLPPGMPAFPVAVRLTSWSFATTSGSKQFLNSSDRRRYLLAQNNTGADLWMNFDTDAGVGNGIKIADGWSAEWYIVIPSNALFFYAAVGGNPFTVLEG